MRAGSLVSVKCSKHCSVMWIMNSDNSQPNMYFVESKTLILRLTLRRGVYNVIGGWRLDIPKLAPVATKELLEKSFEVASGRPVDLVRFKQLFRSRNLVRNNDQWERRVHDASHDLFTMLERILYSTSCCWTCNFQRGDKKRSARTVCFA